MKHTSSSPLFLSCSGLAALGVFSGAFAQHSITILHHNDGESQVIGSDVDPNYGGLDRFVTLAAQQKSIYEAMGHGVVTVSAGDNFLPGAEFAASLATGDIGSRTYYSAIGQAAIDYDAIIVGNHDMDLGPELLGDYIQGYQNAGGSGAWLSANLDVSGEASLNGLISSSTIATVNTGAGMKRIGIVGATTENLPFISSPGNDIVINSVVASVQAEVDDLRNNQGVDHVILVSHLQGLDEDRNVLPQLTGVDANIAGGGDEFLFDTAAEAIVDGDNVIPGQSAPIGSYPTDSSPASTTAIATAPGNYQYLGRLTLDFDAAGNLTSANGNPIVVKDASLGGSTPGVTGDASVNANVVTPVENFVAALNSNVLGDNYDANTSPTVLTGTSNSVRSQETNTGNLVADAYLEAAQDRAASFGVNSTVDFALANGGGIRNGNLDISDNAGGVTEGDTFGISPFSNFVTVVENVSSSDLKLLLENAYSRLVVDTATGQIVRQGDGTGRFAQLSNGVELIVDVDATAMVLDTAGNIITNGERIEYFAVNGRVIIENGVAVSGETVTFALPDFLATGGDQYFFFDQDGSNARGLDSGEFTRLGITDQQALADYIENVLNGDLSSPDYQVGGNDRISLQTNFVIPEPDTIALLALGLLGITRLRRRKA